MNPCASIVVLLLALVFPLPLHPEDDEVRPSYERPLKIKVGERMVLVRSLKSSPPDLLNAVLEQYAADNHVRPTEKEIAQYSIVVEARWFDPTLRGTLREVEEMLKSPFLGTKERKELIQQRNDLQKQEKEFRRRRELGEFREYARTFLVRWKTMAALHAQHGGRLVLKYGPIAEPVDAFAKLVDERQKAGDFEEWPPAVQRELLAYYTGEEWGKKRGGREVPANIAETYFTNPRWMTISKEEISDFEGAGRHILLFRAGERYQRGEFSAALDFADRALALDPENDRAMVWRARAFLGKKQPVLAVEAFEQVLEMNCLEPQYWIELGRVVAAQGNPEEAGRLFDEAVNLRADFSSLANRGRHYLNRGQVDLAIADLARAVEEHEKAHQTLTQWSGPSPRDQAFYLPEIPVSEVARQLGDAYMAKKDYVHAMLSYGPATTGDSAAEALRARAAAKTALGIDVQAAEDLAMAQEIERARTPLRKAPRSRARK